MMSVGKEVMSEKTDKRALLKQRLPIALLGVAAIVFVIAILIADVLIDDSYFAVNAPSHIMIFLTLLGVLLIYLAFFGILYFELTVYEEGFYFRYGKREGTVRFDDVKEMAYGVVTHRGKEMELIRVYIIFNTTEADVFLPSISKDKTGGWAEISDCLLEAYMNYSGRDLTENVRYIPL